jgi:hypothetical protein
MDKNCREKEVNFFKGRNKNVAGREKRMRIKKVECGKERKRKC